MQGNDKPIPITPRMNFNIDELEDLKCKNDNCEGTEFDVVYILKKVPAMLSPTGKEVIGPVPYFRCTSCFKRTNIMKTP